MALTNEQIELLLEKKKRGRPMLRDGWGRLILKTLQDNPEGLEPFELQSITGLEPQQIAGGMRWLRDTSHDGLPCLYVPAEHRYFATDHYYEQLAPGVRTNFVKRAVTLVSSAQKLLSQAEDREEFKPYQREIRRFLRDAARVQEDAEDLVEAL